MSHSILSKTNTFSILITLLLTVWLSQPLSAIEPKRKNQPQYAIRSNQAFQLSSGELGDNSVKALGRLGAMNSPSGLELVRLSLSQNGKILVDGIPSSRSIIGDHMVGKTRDRSLVVYSIDPSLQILADKLIKEADSKHVAIVMMEPKSGRILAIGQKSSSIDNFALHADLPAASIFKLITTAAALDTDGISTSLPVKFRGGIYTLNEWNYKSSKKDNRVMPLDEALGKSCNPVFSRIALNYLDRPTLEDYATRFGFNANLGFDIPLPKSRAVIPTTEFELGRTAAGFGKVFFSPLHAATLVSAVANKGNLLRPTLIQRVSTADGKLLYQAEPELLGNAMSASAAGKLLNMMEATTTKGTSRKEFQYRRSNSLKGIRVAGKTGTLRGTNPEGINHWFVAAAPIENPRIAIATLVVSPGKPRISASRIGRQMLERYFSLY